MGRAARRAQEKADRRQRAQQRLTPARAPRISMSGPAGEDQRPRGSTFKPWTWRWIADIISELRKVTWPSRQETTHLTTVVLIVSLFVGLVLGAADIGFNWLVENTILR